VPSPTPPNVVVSQQFVDDAARAFAEVVALRDALKRVQDVNNLMMSSERKAVDAAIVAFNTMIAIQDKLIISYTQLDEVRVKTITAQALIIDRLMTQLGKKPSFWDKLLAALKTAASIVFGIAIGRAM